jgi:hypothetical protein
MKRTQLALSALLMAPMGAAFAAPVEYAFDTVTAIDLDAVSPSVSGVLLNSSSTAIVHFLDNTNVSYRYIVNRCVPVFITAMEKPGKYVLRITVDPAQSNVQLVGCRLELKS